MKKTSVFDFLVPQHNNLNKWWLLMVFFFVLFASSSDWAWGQQVAVTPLVECGTSPTNLVQQQQSCNYVPPSCVRTVKVNVTFIQRTNGYGNFRADGPPTFVRNTPAGPFYSSTLPVDYNGTDYAQDLICKVNSLMDNNAPDNMCNGWYYLTNPLSPFYDADFVMPATPPPTMIRFHLSQVRYKANDALYYTDNAPLNSQLGYDVLNEIELYVYANIPTGSPGGYGYPDGKYSIIYGQMNNSGWGLLAGGLETHELGHVLGLNHTFAEYICPSNAAQCATVANQSSLIACPFFDPLTDNICNHSYTNNTTYSAFNTTCTPTIAIQMNAQMPYADVPLQHNCQAGIGTAAGIWSETLCDQPTEIGSNIMSYCYGNTGHNISPCQLGIMHEFVNALGAGYLMDPLSISSIFPNVAINDGLNNSACNTNIDHICEYPGTPEAPATVLLDAGNNWGAGATYLWSTTATTQTITVNVPNGATTYTVTVTNASGCTGTDAIIVAGPPAEVSIPPVEPFCGAFNDLISITPIVSNNVTSYQWAVYNQPEFSDHPYWQTFDCIDLDATGEPYYYECGDDATIQIGPSQSGIYSVTVTADNGCTASATVNVVGHLSPLPVVVIENTSAGLTTCINQPLIVNIDPGDNDAEYVSYIWTNGDTTPSSTFNYGDTNSNGTPITGEYYGVTVTDANGCTGTDAAWLNIVSQPNINITGNTNICGTGFTNLTANISNPTGLGVSYVWSNGSTSANTTVNSPGIYTVTVNQTFSVANGGTYPCSATATITVTATPPTTPILLPIPSPICQTDAPIDLTQYVSNYTNVTGGDFIVIGTNGIPQTIEDLNAIFDPALFAPDTYTIQYTYQPPGCDVATSQIQTLVVQDCSPLGCIALQTYLSFSGNPNYTAPADADAAFTTWTTDNNPFGAGLGLSSNPVKINGTITIPDNSEIRIDGMHFVFGPNGRIDVRRRGQLTLKRSIFEGDPTCNTMWQGFRVWGPGVNNTVANNEGGEQQDADGGIHTGMLLFDGDPANPTNVIVRDAIIGVATTRLDNYNLATVASSLTSFNAGGIPYALTPSAVSVLPQLVGVGSTQAEGYGGGWLHIRKASGARFENCFYGTLYTQYQGGSYIQPAALAADGINGYKIDAAVFTTNGNLRYPFTAQSTEIGVAGLKVLKTKLSIANSTFENLHYGIRSNDLRQLNVRSLNQFNNCLRGISAQVTNLGATQFTRIEGNTFNSCQLGIQADALQTLITGNNIYGLPGQTEMSVGIFMRDSDYSIGGNYAGLGTNFAGNFISDVTVGIAVIGGTEDPTAVISPEIKNNTISRTNVAIHTINNNQDLDIACNQLLNYNYRGINIRSWNGTQGNLKDQGDCNNPLAQFPAFNTFFPLGTLPKDLFADATSLDFKYADIGALALTVNDATLITREGCDNTTPPCNTYQPAALSKLIDNSTPTKTKYKILSEWLRQYQVDSNYVAAAALLEQNTALPGATLKLIQQYYDTENYTAADALLEGIDRTRLETDQFYTLQKMLIQLKQEGKTLANISANQEATLLNIANSHTSVGYRAQAILYQARGYEFPVIIPPLSDGDAYGYTVFKTINANNSTLAINSFSLLYPNPTKDQLFLDYALDNEQQATISLFDLNGRIVKQDKLTGNGKLQWSVETLPSGFYYYQIQKNNEHIITDKVIIIK